MNVPIMNINKLRRRIACIMGKIKKHKKLMIILSVVSLLMIAIGLFYISHSTYWKYNDWWIVGKHIDSVEKRYGKFDINKDHLKGYYIGKDDSIVMPSHLEQYYWIEFDDDGIVTKVYLGGPIGG